MNDSPANILPTARIAVNVEVDMPGVGVVSMRPHVARELANQIELALLALPETVPQKEGPKKLKQK